MIGYLKSAIAFLGMEVLTFLIVFYYLWVSRVSKTNKLYICFIGFSVVYKFLLVCFSFSVINEAGSYWLYQTASDIVGAWVFNAFDVCFVAFHLYYFTLLLKNKNRKLLLRVFAILYSFVSVLVFAIYPDMFFIQISPFVHILGSALLLLGVFFYLKDVLKRPSLLESHECFSMFVVGAVGVYDLGRLPFYLYAFSYKCYNNQEFVALYMQALQVINYMVFIIYIIGISLCLLKKRI